LLQEKPLKGGFLLRNHNKTSVIAAMEEWLAQVLRYSRRDQLSFNYVLRRNALSVSKLDIDVRNADYFTWPVNQGRNQKEYSNKGTLSGFLISEIARKEQILQELALKITEKEKALLDLQLELRSLRRKHPQSFFQSLRAFLSRRGK
jgi:hypothetical protein